MSFPPLTVQMAVSHLPAPLNCEVPLQTRCLFLHVPSIPNLNNTLCVSSYPVLQLPDLPSSLDLLPTELCPRILTTLDLELVVCGHSSSPVVSHEPQGPGIWPCQLWKGLAACYVDRPRPSSGLLLG